MKPRPPIVQNPAYEGWARTRGWFRPWIELGKLGMMLEGGYLGGLIAHEHVHMVRYHRLQVLASFVWNGGLAVALTWWLFSTVDPHANLVLRCFAGLLGALLGALSTLRRCEREADAHAALKLGRMWHKLLSKVLYVQPTTVDLLVYGTREARLKRVMRIAEQTENAGYAPGGTC